MNHSSPLRSDALGAAADPVAGREAHRLRRRGFTLIEILIGLTVLAVLLALLIPGVRRSVLASHDARCMSNLRQIGVAFHLYAGEHGGMLPELVFRPGESNRNRERGTGEQWDAQVMPYLGITDATRGNTVFYCPTSVHYYPNQPHRTLSYSFNENVGRNHNGSRTLASNDHPGTVVMLADFEAPESRDDNNLSVPYKSTVHQTFRGRNNRITFRPSEREFEWLSYRHGDQHVNILFVDGHVESRTRVDRFDPETPPRRVRWTSRGTMTPAE